MGPDPSVARPGRLVGGVVAVVVGAFAVYGSEMAKTGRSG